ncbi:MAG TPA: RsfA family transcriptional regulator [Bacillales bacterium]|nr:RsfA family transcriptional regulator [Bacillales bacterium]
MAKIRQDAWSKENDLLLADTVLRHIREGGTQLKAFEEVGDKLNRTSAACGFRWNAIVRDQYQQAIEIAKKQRKERKRIQFKQKGSSVTPGTQQKRIEKPQTASQRSAVHYNQSTPDPDQSTMTLDDVISYLQGLNANEGLEMENERLEGETDRLRNENDELKKQLATLQQKHETVNEDYQSLIQIMDRARKMVAFQGEDQNPSSFRMDKNGNLEKIAK